MGEVNVVVMVKMKKLFPFPLLFLPKLGEVEESLHSSSLLGGLCWCCMVG